MLSQLNEQAEFTGETKLQKRELSNRWVGE
jgi:hypothetical protein